MHFSSLDPWSKSPKSKSTSKPIVEINLTHSVDQGLRCCLKKLQSKSFSLGLQCMWWAFLKQRRVFCQLYPTVGQSLLVCEGDSLTVQNRLMILREFMLLNVCGRINAKFATEMKWGKVAHYFSICLPILKWELTANCKEYAQSSIHLLWAFLLIKKVIHPGHLHAAKTF